ncbi:MAG: FAD-binding protein [Oscillospiraceae bacterium]|nr:FAD-binding protein [Oscillospiraceae bacterium]
MNYDVVIIGAGAAGLYTAINLAEFAPQLQVLVLAKKSLHICNTAMAQGGIAFALDEADVEAHIADTLKAGGYANNTEAVRIMVEGSAREYKALCELGMVFDSDWGLEGGHSQRRIAHCKDSTGAALMEVLGAKVRDLSNVTLLENTEVFAVERSNERFAISARCGHRALHFYYTTKVCVLATGGIGKLFDFTTNSEIATGDGIRFAEQLGATLKDMDLVQFHPTGFSDSGRPPANASGDLRAAGKPCLLGTETSGVVLLISEAVRGEGAVLLNERGEEFTDELAPRDVVSKAILSEINQQISTDCVYLDITHKPPEFVKKRFPFIYEKLTEHGYDLTRDRIPVRPCQHYLMGGISTALNGATLVPNLYAVGECACTGVHGNNRLASNSLLEALVFARLTAQTIVTTGEEKS